jgi:hypothetical protein
MNRNVKNTFIFVVVYRYLHNLHQSIAKIPQESNGLCLTFDKGDFFNGIHVFV